MRHLQRTYLLLLQQLPKYILPAQQFNWRILPRSLPHRRLHTNRNSVPALRSHLLFLQRRRPQQLLQLHNQLLPQFRVLQVRLPQRHLSRRHLLAVSPLRLLLRLLFRIQYKLLHIVLQRAVPLQLHLFWQLSQRPHSKPVERLFRAPFPSGYSGPLPSPGSRGPMITKTFIFRHPRRFILWKSSIGWNCNPQFVVVFDPLFKSLIQN
jgi:hypothetical protein